MPEPYRTVVGLEVHVQSLTRTKLFCGCSTKFGAPPNSQTCPVCLGLPGVLPVMNRHAFEWPCAAVALNCTVARFTKWDRKNYYYPDLPKNYQISQYDLPFSRDGWLEIPAAGGLKKIGIIRVHLEEDAGKSLHDESGRGGETKVDLNRTGTPLLEIVTRPEISAPEEARAFLEELRLLMRELHVSDCEMQEGSLRCDANVNVHVPRDDGSVVATPIVEVKNLNSISAVERAVAYEAARQYEAYKESGETYRPGEKETRGWDDARKRTWVQRRKEEEADYRYFPEPDLVPVVVDDAWLDRVRAGVGELPQQQRARLQQEPYNLPAYDAGVITQQGRKFVGYFETVAKGCGDPKAASNWVTNEVLKALNERGETIEEFPVPAAKLAGLIARVNETGLNKQRAREVFDYLMEHPEADAAGAIETLGYTVIADEGRLREIVRRALAANPKGVEQYKQGKTKAADSFKGFVMKETKGMAKMDLVQKILQEELEKA